MIGEILTCTIEVSSKDSTSDFIAPVLFQVYQMPNVMNVLKVVVENIEVSSKRCNF